VVVVARRWNDGYDVTDWLVQRPRFTAVAIDELIATTAETRDGGC
jgi:hypothetical protein